MQMMEAPLPALGHGHAGRRSCGYDGHPQQRNLDYHPRLGHILGPLPPQVRHQRSFRKRQVDAPQQEEV